MANVHPWFAHTTSLAGAQWTWDFFQDTNVNPAALLSNKPEMSIAEVGWPTVGDIFFLVAYIKADPRSYPQASKDAEHATNGGSPASEQDLQTFMDNFVCQSNTKGTKYFFFELFDEKWKDDIYGGVEGHWGLLYQKCVPRVPLIPNADRSPTAKPSKASPSQTVLFNSWTLLHPVTVLTTTLLILWFPTCPIVGRWLHPPSHASDYSAFNYEPSPFFFNTPWTLCNVYYLISVRV